LLKVLVIKYSQVEKYLQVTIFGCNHSVKMNEGINILYCKRAKFVIALTVLLGCFFNAGANIQFFDYSNGLANEKITAICKDKSGLMWIGTEGGLNQFNGYEFVEVRFFRDHSVKVVYYDSVQNTLWVGTNLGLFLFNVETHEVLHASARMQQPAVAGIGFYNHDIVVTFRCGDVLSFARSGAVRILFTLNKKRIKQNEVVNGTAFDGAGYVYLLTSNHDFPVLSVNLQNGTGTYVKGLSEFTIWNISSGNGQILINCNNDQVAFYSESGNRDLRFLEISDRQNDDPTRIIQEINGTYFISYRESYGHYNLNEKKWQWQQLEKNGLNRTLKSKNIKLFYLDDNQVLWLGTSKGMIKVSTDYVYEFKRLLSDPDKSASVRQIVAGRGDQLFIATYDGIYDYNQKTGTNTLLSNTPKGVDFPLYARALYFDKGSYLYAGTESSSNYFYRYNLKTKTFEGKFFISDHHGLKITSVFSIIMDKAGIIWLATDVGLASFNPADKKITLHTRGKFSVGTRRLMYLQHSGYPGKFWACGKGGAFLIDSDQGVERSYDFSTVLGAADIEYLFASDDARHNVWLTTQKYGIVMVPVNNDEPVIINTSDGLASNEVYAVIWENDHIAWVSTSDGLSRYDTHTKLFNNYLYDNGIADDEFNQHSFYKASDTLLYMGGINGVTYFNPQKFKTPKTNTTIFLANITRWGSEDKKKQVSFRTDDIQINPTDYLITLNFGLSDYTNASSNSFYYTINNLNNNWISLGTKNSLTLNGLAPGEYQLRVKGINKFGIESDNMLRFSILVKERFYNTSWFYVLLSIVFISMVSVYFRWRLNRITQRQLLRTQISSNLHDEVGSLLTQIVISTDNALYANQNIEEKNKRLGKISALSRNAINTMSDVLWSIDSRNDFVGNLTDRMREHAELMLADKGIELSFEFSNVRVLKGIDPEIRQQLYLIFKETIHNILKHSKATQVKVTFKKEGKGFGLTVSNNNHSEALTFAKMHGQGMNNIRMRAKKIKASASFSIINDWFVVSVEKK
jgi:ligand-binding sensor domain-containing protein